MLTTKIKECKLCRKKHNGNHGQDTYSDIWSSCVYYNCSTDGGAVTGEMVS